MDVKGSSVPTATLSVVSTQHKSYIPTDAEKTEKCLLQLKALIEDNQLLHNHVVPEPYLADQYLERFVRVRKYDAERAFHMLKEFICHGEKHRKLMSKLYPSNYKWVFDLGLLNVLKGKDQLGRRVILFRTELWDPSEVCVDDLISIMILVLGELVSSPETQKCGIVFCADQTGLAFKHFRAFSLSRVISIIQTLQGKYPLMCKGLHNVNDSYLLHKLGMFAKPFFSPKLAKRIHFHGPNYCSFHKHVPVEILPKSLGGLLESWEDAVDEKLMQVLLSRDLYYKRIANYYQK